MTQQELITSLRRRVAELEEQCDGLRAESNELHRLVGRAIARARSRVGDVEVFTHPAQPPRLN